MAQQYKRIRLLRSRRYVLGLISYAASYRHVEPKPSGSSAYPLIPTRRPARSGFARTGYLDSMHSFNAFLQCASIFDVRQVGALVNSHLATTTSTCPFESPFVGSRQLYGPKWPPFLQSGAGPLPYSASPSLLRPRHAALGPTCSLDAVVRAPVDRGLGR